MTTNESTPAPAVLANRVLSTDDVQSATATLTQLLAHNSVETEQEDKYGRQHVLVDGERLLFLKTPRDHGENSNDGLDLFVELVTHRLLSEFNLPVGPMSLADHDEHGPVLVMPNYEETDRDLKDYSNADELNRLCVFELWVHNSDDTKDHFMATETNLGPEFRVIDHGHALHRYWYQRKELDDPAEIDDALFEPSGDQFGSHVRLYGVSSVDDVREYFPAIRGVSNVQLEGVVDGVLNDLRCVSAGQDQLTEFLDTAPFHREAALRTLKFRRDGIERLAEERLGIGE